MVSSTATGMSCFGEEFRDAGQECEVRVRERASNLDLAFHRICHALIRRDFRLQADTWKYVVDCLDMAELPLTKRAWNVTLVNWIWRSSLVLHPQELASPDPHPMLHNVSEAGLRIQDSVLRCIELGMALDAELGRSHALTAVGLGISYQQVSAKCYA